MNPPSLQRAIAHLTVQESELQRSLDEQSKQIAQANDVAQSLARTEEELSRARSSQKEVQTRLDQLDMERNSPGRIGIAAYGISSSRPSQDRRVVFTLLAVSAAGLIGLGLGYLRDAADASIHEVLDVRHAVRAPFLGQLPTVANPLNATGDGLLGRVLYESVRMVRTALVQRLRDYRSCAVVVTSPSPGAGKSTTAVLLAKSLAELGKRVLLIDADLRRRSLSQWFAAESAGGGLNTLLAGGGQDRSVIRRAAEWGFDLLPAGNQIGSRDSELLANGALTESLTRWKADYDFILIDSPPVLAVADGRILAAHADGAIMVLRAAQSRRADAVEAFASLSSSGGRLLGTVLIDTPRSSSFYGRYADYDASSARAPAAAGQPDAADTLLA